MATKNNTRKSLGSEVAQNVAPEVETAVAETTLTEQVNTGSSVVEQMRAAEAEEAAEKEALKDETKAEEPASEETVAEAKAEAQAETVAAVVPVAGTFAIDDNVPMPGAGTGGGRSKYPWNDLKVGQSFFVPGAKPETFYTLCSSQRKKSGKTYVSRKVEGGVRVWLSADAPAA